MPDSGAKRSTHNMTPMLTLCTSVAVLALVLPAGQIAQVAPIPRAAGAPYTSSGTKTIDVNLPSLKYFCDGKDADLKRYIEASPRWRVGVERLDGKDVAIAYRRLDSRITTNGFIGSKTQTRVGFVFAEKPSKSELMLPCVTQVAPDAGATEVAICSYRLIPSQRNAYLFVGVPNLWLSTVEIDSAGELSLTPGLLKEVETELAGVRKAAEEGKPLAALSSKETRKGEPAMTIDDSEQQVLHIEAWINPGEPGVTEVRVKFGDGSKDLTISQAYLYARERVGYSDDPAQLFYANSKVEIRETAKGWDSTHDVLFQLWFTPDSGADPRKLIELRQTILGWER